MTAQLVDADVAGAAIAAVVAQLRQPEADRSRAACALVAVDAVAPRIAEKVLRGRIGLDASTSVVLGVTEGRAAAAHLVDRTSGRKLRSLCGRPVRPLRAGEGRPMCAGCARRAASLSIAAARLGLRFRPPRGAR